MIHPHSGVCMLLEYGGESARKELDRLEGRLIAGMRQAHDEGECPRDICPACKLGRLLAERDAKEARP